MIFLLSFYFSFQPVLHDWCNKGRGMCYPVCGMVHIKEPLLLIKKSSPCSGGSGFPLSLSECFLWRQTHGQNKVFQLFSGEDRSQTDSTAILYCIASLTYRLHCSKSSSSGSEFGRKEMVYLTMHSTHFIYDYMASDIW